MPYTVYVFVHTSNPNPNLDRFSLQRMTFNSISGFALRSRRPGNFDIFVVFLCEIEMYTTETSYLYSYGEGNTMILGLEHFWTCNHGVC